MSFDRFKHKTTIHSLNYQGYQILDWCRHTYLNAVASKFFWFTLISWQIVGTSKINLVLMSIWFIWTFAWFCKIGPLQRHPIYLRMLVLPVCLTLATHCLIFWAVSTLLSYCLPNDSCFVTIVLLRFGIHL